ncbi:hypothetical protein [Amycolatopsis azurea]|uniref:Uncharacterized protein n=1 Tax=Amycolatopsis azurea DSM 43854 TaxID=1238180 RepID=A0ABX3JLF7_9PSEU|nr:hypothetical protein [Amycolatopsis azurea]OOC08180.1 hypothetical protein B0293_04805 [Amycolatopsis azurea DSM 43854]
MEPVRVKEDEVRVEYGQFFVTDEAGWDDIPVTAETVGTMPGGAVIRAEDGVKRVRLEFWGEPLGEPAAVFETSTGRVRLLSGGQEPSSRGQVLELDGPGGYGFDVERRRDDHVLRWWKERSS